MTEEDARAWLEAQGHGAAAVEKLGRLVDLIGEENGRQNLIAASTLPHIWGRHVVDSVQLLHLAGPSVEEGVWVDLGSGGGFPGLVIACLRAAPVILVEARGLRARFLQRCVEELNLSSATVKQERVERVTLDMPAAVVSARAFASLDRTFGMASHFCDENTLWLLPKGRSAEIELVTARKEWQAVFHVEQSVTSADSAIVVASGLKRRHVGVGKSARRRKA